MYISSIGVPFIIIETKLTDYTNIQNTKRITNYTNDKTQFNTKIRIFTWI